MQEAGMRFTASLEGFEGQNIEVYVGFLSAQKLLVNGEAAPTGSKRGEMLLRRNDGRQVVATWKQQVLGLDISQLVVDGQVTRFVEPLNGYQLMWGGLPVLLVSVGGALGALVGVIGFSVNTKIFRTEMNTGLKYLVSGLISVLAVTVYFIVAVILSLLFGK
jgi:hypothetical protein